MKILKSSAICVLLSVCVLQTSAQQNQPALVNEPELNKPKLFKTLPDRIPLNSKEFERLFDLQTGEAVSIPFSSNFLFNGKLVSKSDDSDPMIRSIVVRSSNLTGATLVLTKAVNADNTISFRGRIISLKHGDAYELANENGVYYLLKKGSYDLYNE